MNYVLGSNVTVLLNVSDTYYPVFCAKSAELIVEQDEVEVTSVNSGSSREYETGMDTARLLCAGVTVLDNSGGMISWLYLYQQRKKVHQIRVVLEDRSGNVKTLSFNAIIFSLSLSKQDVNSWSQSAVEMRVSGPILSDTVAPPGVNVYSDYWDTTEGSTVLSGTSVQYGYNLSGKTVVAVYREGIEYDLVNGAPTGRQCRHVGGTIVFDFPFNQGERIFVIFI